MRNADILAKLPGLPAMRQDAASADREGRKLLARAESLDRDIEVLTRVSEVRDGVALHRVGGEILAVGEDIRRCADTYPNARNQGATWGLRTYTDAFGRQGEVWWGAGWAKADAEAAAVAWVTRGIAPAAKQHEQ